MPPVFMLLCVYYSVLSATTGSFFAAILEGISPAIRVSAMLIKTRAVAPETGRIADSESISVREWRTMFIGRIRSSDIPIPSAPATNPTISVSALNTLEISLFEAPTERSIPISFVLYRTEI